MADNGIANNQKLSQHTIDRDGTKLPCYTNLQTLQKSSATDSKVEPYQQSVVSSTHVESNNYHGQKPFNTTASAEERQFHNNFLPMNPGITVNDHGSSSNNHQTSRSAQIGLHTSQQPRNLGPTLDVQPMNLSRETSHSPNPTPVSPSNQRMQETTKNESIVIQTKAEEVSQEVATDVVQNLSHGSLEEIEQAIKARVLSLLNPDGTRKRKAETAGIVETPDPKRRVSCDQCNKTMGRRCDLRYPSLSHRTSCLPSSLLVPSNPSFHGTPLAQTKNDIR